MVLIDVTIGDTQSRLTWCRRKLKPLPPKNSEVYRECFFHFLFENSSTTASLYNSSELGLHPLLKMLIEFFTWIGIDHRCSKRSAMLALESRSSMGPLTFRNNERWRQLDFYPSLFFTTFSFNFLPIKFARELSPNFVFLTYRALTSEIRDPTSRLALQTCRNYVDLDKSRPLFIFLCVSYNSLPHVISDQHWYRPRPSAMFIVTSSLVRKVPRPSPGVTRKA